MQIHSDKTGYISKPFFRKVELVCSTIQRYKLYITLQTYFQLFLRFLEKCNEYGQKGQKFLKFYTFIFTRFLLQ